MSTFSDELAREVKGHFENVSRWLEGGLEAGVRSGQLTFTATVRSEPETQLSLVYGSMLTALAYVGSALFKRVRQQAVDRLVASA